VTAHGSDINRMPLKHPIIKKMTSYILKEADSIIAVSNDLKNTISSKYEISEEKIHVISMGINPEIFYQQDKRQLREQSGIPFNQALFLFVGNVIESKGVRELIQAFCLYHTNDPLSKLMIIGSLADRKFVDEMNEIIEKNGVSHAVHFTGTKTQSEVASWMNRADVFVLPSHSEGLGLVVLEAFACGIPVISTQVGGLQEITSGDTAWIVPVANAQGLFESMEIVTKDAILREKMVKLGKIR
jgi:glycosyltransferase involved in cell wall biosynthesis